MRLCGRNAAAWPGRGDDRAGRSGVESRVFDDTIYGGEVLRTPTE
jgi:hypothetical protein